MKCPRCRGAAPDGVSFCPNCGNDLRVFQQSPAQKQQVPVKEQMRKVAPAAAAPAGYFQPQTGPAAMPLPIKKSKLGWIVAGIAAALLMCLGVYGFLAKTGKGGGDALAKRASMGGPMLAKTGKEAPLLDVTAKNPAAMPDDVLRWLQHLERIEKKRGTLMRGLLASFATMLKSGGEQGTDLQSLKALATGDPDAPDPKMAPDIIADQATDSKKEMDALRKDFDSYPPPAECQTIADSYGHALDETGHAVTDIVGAMAGWKEDPQAAVKRLTNMEHTSGDIDKFGTEADGKVQAICDKYNKRKWFSVNGDFGNSGIFQSLGVH